jgi:DNA-binding Lrp family transcriptional regulator
MIQDGTIRHLGPFFNSRKMGYKGALAAVNVPESQIDSVAEVLGRFPEITHNYLRDGEPNMWFTIIAKTLDEQQKIVGQIKEETGIDEVLLFPSRKLFKVKVDLE